MKFLGLNFDFLIVFGGLFRVFGVICFYYNYLEFGNFVFDIIKDVVLNKEGKSIYFNKNWFNVVGFFDCFNIFCIMMMLCINNIL